jgi:hypothetical protein
MNYQNCSCNVCGGRIYAENPRASNKYCGPECKAIDAIKHDSKYGIQYDKNYAQKTSGRRSVFDCVAWPSNGAISPS